MPQVEMSPTARPADLSDDRPSMLFVVAVLAALLVLAAGFAMKPVPVLALLVAAAYFAVCLSRPVWALGTFLFVHIAYPAYVRIPPGLPPSVHMLVALAAAIFLVRLVGAARPQPPLGRHGRALVAALALFAAVAMVSLVDPRSTADSLNMWIKVFLFPGLTAWAVFRTLSDETDIDAIVKIMLAAACLTAAFGVYEYWVGSNYLFENFMDENLNDTSMYRTGEVLGPSVAYRSFSVSSQPIEFGAWLSMMLPFALIKFARTRRYAVKAVYAAASAVLVLGVLVTFSRGCLLAVAITCVALGLIVRPLRVWLATGAATAALGLAAIWPYVAEKVADRAGDFDNVTLRFKLWQTAIAIFKDHPINGVGIGNFPLYQLDTVRAHGIGPFFEFGLDSGDLVGVAENTYFQLAAEMGVIGIVAAIVFVGLFFWRVAHLARHGANEGRRDLALCLGAGALAYFVNGLTITAYTHYITTLLFLGAIVGFLLVLLRAEAAGGRTSRASVAASPSTFVPARS